MNIPEEEALKEIRDLANSGKKIAAIKRIREQFSVSLGDATELLDWIMKNDASTPRPVPTAPAMMSRGGLRFDPSIKLPLFIFLGVGLILLIVAACLIANEISFRKSATQVEGVVVENLRNRRSFTPVFEFQWKGELKRAESNISSSVNNRPAYRAVAKSHFRMAH